MIDLLLFKKRSEHTIQVKGNFNGNNTISSYYDADFIAVDVYSEFANVSGNFGFIQQGTTLVSNTTIIIDYFKQQWPGIKLCTAELGFGENVSGGTPTKATLITEFYSTMAASGIVESIMYFDSGADPLNTSDSATAAFAAINDDSKQV